MNIDIDAHYPLSDAQIAFFRKNGFIKLSQVLSPELLEHYGREINRLTL